MKVLSVHRCFLFLLIILVFCYSARLCQGCLDDERRALQQIRESMGYWEEPFHSRRYSDDCCKWDGVDCSLTSSRVIRIFFYHIREYEEPWFPDMSLFAQLKELQELHLTGNYIEGLTKPEALCELTYLELLDLSDNQIEDDVQPCWGNMSALKHLNLARNRFQGNLTSIFANLSKIEFIDVSYNIFQGLVPLSTFASLSRLTYLDLSYNYHLDVETETPIWHPSFQIQHLFLAGCNLNRQSGHTIPSFLLSQHNLATVDLSENFLVGEFPTWMLHNVSSVLRLRTNSFVGQFPQDFQNMVFTLVTLDISDNHFDGHLPSNINLFLPNLTRFNASSNRFSGSISSSFGALQNLQQLDLSNNLLSGVIPRSLTRSSLLRYLNLSNNRLKGKLLPSDCNMTELRYLLLQNNLLSGNLPSCMSKSLSLMLLDARQNHLSGTISGQLLVFMKLGALLLGENQFGGDIPKQICQMQELQLLDLSNNNISGNIPSCLANNSAWRHKFQADSWVPIDFTTKGHSYSFRGLPLTLMTAIDFSANQLAGDIPVDIGNLCELHSLNLSHNLLTGHFPTSFKSLIKLKSLDLSHNWLTGRIPPEIVQINTLAIFSVAFNDLSGRIPFDQQFSTFPESSFVGNPGLCGEQLQIKCSVKVNDDDKRDDNPKQKAEGKTGILDEPLIFYSFVFIAYAIGFWSFIAPLCFSINWRRRYFAAVDGWINHFFVKQY